MASRIRAFAGSLLLYVAEKVIGGGAVIAVETLGVDDIFDSIDDEPEGCQHPRSLKAAVMGRLLKRVCLDCKDAFDRSSPDGD